MKQPRDDKINPFLRCPSCGSSKFYSKGYAPNKKRKYKCHDCGKWASYDNNGEKRRVVVISDLHCGHVTGLTPEKYNVGSDVHAQYCEETWQWYCRVIDSLQPINVLIVNGDAIDGRQEKNGGNELLTGDRIKQVQMACDIIERAKPQQIYMTYGTPYHTGKDENFEDLVANYFHATIQNNLRLSVNGCLFDVRHKIGRSNIPHGRYTSLARTSMWADLMREDREKPAVIIRSHVHYFSSVMHSANRIALTTPALQGFSSYGAKECEGNVDFGLVVFEIGEFGTVDLFKPYIAKIETDIEPILKSK